MSLAAVLEKNAMQAIAKNQGCELDSAHFAEYMDGEDELKIYRNHFHFPKNKTIPAADLSIVEGDEECIYLCGNSLGLTPKGARPLVEEELTRWEECGVVGWFDGKRPWAELAEQLLGQMAELVGAEESEVMLQSSLTVNLHLLMIAFYRPTPLRHKILVEGGLFPSDIMAVKSQILLHDLDPEESLVSVSPRPGESTLRTEDILQVIADQGDEIALIMFSGVQFYTGQLFEMEAITAAGHSKGCLVGFDLAHAVGNVEVKLHDWGVDWAAWCSYKYLNGGPGTVGGLFVHKKHEDNTELKRLSGWWGVDLKKRMEMDNEDLPLIPGAKGYAVSCLPVLTSMPLVASLEMLQTVGMAKLIEKQKLLTGYLEMLILENFDDTEVEILTPRNRGCQLSISFAMDLSGVFGEISRHGVVCDVRRSHVIRVAPAPIYNSFRDVYKFVSVLKKVIKENLQ